MIIKMDITSMCSLDKFPEIAKVINCFAAEDDVVTYCCSATPMIFCEDLGCQFVMKDPDTAITEERLEQIDQSFMTFNNCYYDKRDIDRLPRVKWGEMPPEGSNGCVIETKEEGFETTEDLIDYFRGNPA